MLERNMYTIVEILFTLYAQGLISRLTHKKATQEQQAQLMFKTRIRSELQYPEFLKGEPFRFINIGLPAPNSLLLSYPSRAGNMTICYHAYI